VDLDVEARRRGLELKILVTRLRYLGDVILTTPAVSALKSRYPGAEIHYLVERPYAPILFNNPHIESVIPTGRGFLPTLSMLRKGAFTAALDLFYNPRSAWLLYLSGIPIRVGGSRRWRRRLFTHTYAVPVSVQSAISHHLHPLQLFDIRAEQDLPRVYLTEEEEANGRLILQRITGRGQGIVAFHPGGTWPAKRWSASSFAELASQVRKRLGYELLFIAGPGEGRIAEAVSKEAGDGAHILPLQPIRHLASILSHCDAVVANDGGIVHLSVALRRPTVAVFGPTDPEIWFPYVGRGPYEVATLREHCAPCHKHVCEDSGCLEKLQPDLVFEKLERVLTWREQR
jgi:heptosyltransferase-3